MDEFERIKLQNLWWWQRLSEQEIKTIAEGIKADMCKEDK